MLAEMREFYEIGTSLAGFRAEQAGFGAFPLPTENTLLAAELLCHIFARQSIPRSLGAICIVELGTAHDMTFVITASGGGDIPDVAINQLQVELQDAIGSTYRRINCLTSDTAAIFYSPSHIDTRQFIRGAFAPPKDMPDENDLRAAINELKALPYGFFGRTANDVQVGGNWNSAMLPIRSLLGCAVALRCGLFQPASQPIARQHIKNFGIWANRHPYPDRAHLATNLDALCIPGGNVHQYLYRGDPNVRISDEPTIQRPLDTAWRVADSSRYCAEPKAFNLIKTRRIQGALVGQLAMWWDERVNRFSTPNLEGSPYTNYMLPCTSCSARSAEMTGGLVPHAMVVQEEPAKPRPAGGTRLRRGSL
ncbi:MAG TPA: hypothetical protein VGC21_25075 [Telluria sp.]|jgi:hypothetical protein